MKKANFFLILAALIFLFSMTGCSSSKEETALFKLEDTGTIAVEVIALLDEKEVPLTPETKIPIENFSKIRLSFTQPNSDSALKVYFDKKDQQFPIDSSPVSKKNRRFIQSFQSLLNYMIVSLIQSCSPKAFIQ